MIFHENRLLVDDSHVISCLDIIFLRKLGKMSQNLSSAAVVIGALRAKIRIQLTPVIKAGIIYVFMINFLVSKQLLQLYVKIKQI